jgi:hypothetical protein
MFVAKTLLKNLRKTCINWSGWSRFIVGVDVIKFGQYIGRCIGGRYIVVRCIWGSIYHRSMYWKSIYRRSTYRRSTYRRSIYWGSPVWTITFGQQSASQTVTPVSIAEFPFSPYLLTARQCISTTGVQIRAVALATCYVDQKIPESLPIPSIL